MAGTNMMSSSEVGRSERDTIVYSRHDPAVRRLRTLQMREGRDRTGLYLIEGIRPLAQAIRQGEPVESVVVAPQVLTNVLGRKLLKRLRISGTPCCRLTPEVYHSLSQAEEPQGIAAVMRQRWQGLETVHPERGLCWIALESVQSAGNLGSVLRTSEAVGGAGVILVGTTADPYDPTTVRASMGALFSQQFVRTSYEAFAAWKRRRQCLLVGTSPSAEMDYKAMEYPQPLVLLMGSESGERRRRFRRFAITWSEYPWLATPIRSIWRSLRAFSSTRCSISGDGSRDRVIWRSPRRRSSRLHQARTSDPRNRRAGQPRIGMTATVGMEFLGSGQRDVRLRGLRPSRSFLLTD